MDQTPVPHDGSMLALHQCAQTSLARPIRPPIATLPCGLPFNGVVFGLRQLGDVQRRVAQGGQRFALGQRDRFVERAGPACDAWYRHLS
jgi:hypothetical protein